MIKRREKLGVTFSLGIHTAINSQCLTNKRILPPAAALTLVTFVVIHMDEKLGLPLL